MARLNGPDLDSAANIIVCLVDATLRANVGWSRAGRKHRDRAEVDRRDR